MAIVDTGAHRTVICMATAVALGLTVKEDAADKFGKFSVPGSDAVHSYAGVVSGTTVLHINEKVLAGIKNLRVIRHPHPFVLLGADVLRGGRPKDSWNFRGLKVITVGLNKVDASLEFEVAGEILEVPLPHAPAGEETHTAIAEVSSGQCLLREF